MQKIFVLELPGYIQSHWLYLFWMMETVSEKMEEFCLVAFKWFLSPVSHRTIICGLWESELYWDGFFYHFVFFQCIDCFCMFISSPLIITELLLGYCFNISVSCTPQVLKNCTWSGPWIKILVSLTLIKPINNAAAKHVWGICLGSQFTNWWINYTAERLPLNIL